MCSAFSVHKDLMHKVRCIHSYETRAHTIYKTHLHKYKHLHTHNKYTYTRVFRYTYYYVKRKIINKYLCLERARKMRILLYSSYFFRGKYSKARVLNQYLSSDFPFYSILSFQRPSPLLCLHTKSGMDLFE